jgi:hypothetical protein
MHCKVLMMRLLRLARNLEGSLVEKVQKVG